MGHKLVDIANLDPTRDDEKLSRESNSLFIDIFLLTHVGETRGRHRASDQLKSLQDIFYKEILAEDGTEYGRKNQGWRKDEKPT